VVYIDFEMLTLAPLQSRGAASLLGGIAYAALWPIRAAYFELVSLHTSKN